MNTEEIPLSITVVSQIEDNGPFVGVIERHGKEVWRTWDSYQTSTAAFTACWDHLHEDEPEDPHDYEPDERKENYEESSPLRRYSFNSAGGEE